MKQEDQHTEFKQSWRDEYLKSVAAFANSNGGNLVIGLDDSGKPVGVADSKKLLEDITNKAQNILGILVSPRLVLQEGHEIIYVEVPASPHFAVSYRGKYYQRSGATTQELGGANLNAFLLKRTGQTFDALPQPNPVQLSRNAIDQFKRLGNQLRGDNSYNIPDSDLLDKLELLSSNDTVTNAAVIAFHDRPKRLVAGAYVQIGFFDKDPRPLFENEVTGGAILQVEEVLDLIMTKYLIAPLIWIDIHRTERLPIPRAALREAVVNAIIHRDYSVPSPIQIRVGHHSLTINNPGKLPDDIKLDELVSVHPSRRRNPKLAEIFKRAGYVEAWGTGFDTIRKACSQHGNVEFAYHETDSSFEVAFHFEYKNGVDAVDSTINGDLDKTALTNKETGTTTTETALTNKETGPTTTETALTSKETGPTTIEIDLTSIETGTTTIETALTSKETGTTTIEKALTSKEIETSQRNRNPEMPAEILKQLEAEPTLTAKQLSARLNITVKNVYYHLASLKSQGKLSQVGPTKKPYWKVL